MDGIDELSRIPPYIRCRIVALNERGLNNCKYMILSLEKTMYSTCTCIMSINSVHVVYGIDWITSIYSNYILDFKISK
jgi:hypothetical protein